MLILCSGILKYIMYCLTYGPHAYAFGLGALVSWDCEQDSTSVLVSSTAQCLLPDILELLTCFNSAASATIEM